MKIVHQRQQQPMSCAAACFSMITKVTEEQAIKICKTKKSGTSSHDLANALDQKGFSYHWVTLRESFTKIWWLRNLSFHFPIYASCNYISNSGKGRNSHRHHAVVFADGKIFDPAESMEIDFDCYLHTFNRDLIIKHILVIDAEMDNYINNEEI